MNSEVLCAGLANFLMLGLLWSVAYVLVGQLIPDSFAFSTGPEESQRMNGFNAFYFSLVTLTTVGYGDITPVSNVARMLAVMESTTGLLYVAVLIARLVALHTIQNESAPPDTH